MKKLILFLLTILFVCSAVFAQADRNTRYVAVRSTELKSSTGFFAATVGTLSLGDAVTLISESGKWSQVRSGAVTGWVASSEISVRRVVAANNTGVSASEVALAGKGFSAENEAEHRRSGADYSMVDLMEQTTVPPADLLRFIDDGRLKKGE